MFGHKQAAYGSVLEGAEQSLLASWAFWSNLGSAEWAAPPAPAPFPPVGLLGQSPEQAEEWVGSEENGDTSSPS